VPEARTEALVGLILNRTATAATIFTLAEADLVGSATLVAFTYTVGGEGTFTGGTYIPFTKIVPHVAPVQPAPVTVQVAAIFEAPVTFAKNCRALPTVTVALFGFTVMARGVALTVRMAVLLATLPVELLATTLNWLPLSGVAEAVVV
jgi:hypothetical protein